MKKSRGSLLLFGILGIFLNFSCTDNEENMKEDLVYPEIEVEYANTRKGDVIEDYHGTAVADPFRWLEVDTARDVEDWVSRQNKVTFGYLGKIPFRSKLRKRYEELFNYTKLSAPRKVGSSLIYYKNDGLQNQPVIYIENKAGEEEVLIDPNTWSEGGTTSISIAGFSDNDKYMAFSIQEAGSDWREIRIMDIETRKELPEQIQWVKFSGASWYSDGFYYSRYPEPQEGMELSEANSFHSVYYHKLGTDPSDDLLIYRDDEHPKMYHNVSVTEDEKYVILYKASGTDGYETWFMPLDRGVSGTFRPLYEGFKQKNGVVDHKEGSFYVLTDVDAPNYRLVKVPVKDPGIENWSDVIPENEYLLENVNTGGGKLFAIYLRNATNRVYEYNYDGERLKEIELPGTGSSGGFGGKIDDESLYYTFTSFIYPPSIFKYDLKSGESMKYFETELAFSPEDYEEKQVVYKSKDGTDVSMFIVHKKGLELDGNNPAYLYGYGGFNISLTPGFSSSRILLLENGGVFAMPNLRGG